MRAFRVSFALQASQDLLAIQRFLFRAHRGFGRSREEAARLAQARIERIRAAAFGLGQNPQQGTLRLELGPDVRSVTKERAIFYFTCDDAREEVRVLAIFFGGQDHQRLMLRRALEEEP